jgi:hypothetical protein
MELKMSTIVVEPAPGIALVLTPRMPLLKVPREASEPVTSCPVCGDRWTPWMSSRLQCHAACLFDDDDLLRLRKAWLNCKTDFVKLAKAIGISAQSMRSLLNHAAKLARAEQLATNN